jgi:hypothetical protein
LIAYAKLDATKEPGKALEALKEIAELAVKLKKANPAKEEVVAHLDEVVKEVKKTTPNLEARIKLSGAATAGGPANPAADAKPAEEEEDEDQEAAEFKKDLKKQLVSALAQVKLRAPGDPEQQKEPKPQLKFIAYLAGKSCAVVVAGKVAGATKKLLPDIAGGASGGKFIQGECIFEKNTHTFVLEKVPGGLAKKLAKALAAETGQKYKVRVRSTDGSMTLDSDTDVDADDDAAPPAAAPAGSGQEMVKFKERLTALLPQIKAMPQVKLAAGTKDEKGLNVLASEAGYFANKKDFAQANQLLDQVEALLKNAAASVSAWPPPPEPPLSSAALPDTLAAWQKARAAAITQLRNLGAAIKAAKDPEADQALIAIEAVAKNLTESPATAKSLQELERYIQTDEVVAEAELPNPFGVAISLRAPLIAALAALKTQLAPEA